MWTYIWLGVLAVSLIVEFVTLELVSVWVSIGALASMVLAICGVSLNIQLLVFVIVTILCILCLRKVTLKLLNKNNSKTNMDVIVNTTHKLIKPITEDECGAIKINGVEWSVKFENDDTAEVGEIVKILEVNGNKFIVKKADLEEKEETTNNVTSETEENTKTKEQTKTEDKENKLDDKPIKNTAKKTSEKKEGEKAKNTAKKNVTKTNAKK